MSIRLLWIAAVIAGWLLAGCSNDTDGTIQTAIDSGLGIESNSDVDGVLVAVDQSPPSGANGLALDAEGMIWLADLIGNQVLRFDPTSGKILARFKHDQAGPDDVAIDQQGRVFWTGWSNGQIGRIDPKTKEEEIIAQLPEGANSIAFSDQGRLFIGLVILNYGLYEIDPEGIVEPRLITDALGSLNAFDFGPNGHLWGPLDGAVVKIDIETGEIVETNIAGGYFSVRYNDKDNSLYALGSNEDYTSHSLDKIDLSDYSVSTVSKPEMTLVDNFIIDPDGDYYVTGFNVPLVSVIGSDGTNKKLIEIGE